MHNFDGLLPLPDVLPRRGYFDCQLTTLLSYSVEPANGVTMLPTSLTIKYNIATARGGLCIGISPPRRIY